MDKCFWQLLKPFWTAWANLTQLVELSTNTTKYRELPYWFEHHGKAYLAAFPGLGPLHCIPLRTGGPVLDWGPSLRTVFNTDVTFLKGTPKMGTCNRFLGPLKSSVSAIKSTLVNMVNYFSHEMFWEKDSLYLESAWCSDLHPLALLSSSREYWGWCLVKFMSTTKVIIGGLRSLFP